MIKKGCEHDCTSNCRREGCNCECGEWHDKAECPGCDGSGEIEIMGGSASDEWGVIDVKPCAECNQD